MRWINAGVIIIAVCASTLYAAPLLNFSGNSYVDIGTPARLQMSKNQPFTVEGWVKPSSISGTQMIYSKNASRGSPYTYMFGFYDNGKQMYAYTGNGGVPANTWRSATISPALQANRWYHLAFSYDGINMSFILNGQVIGTQPYSFGNAADHTIKLGGYSNGTDIQGNLREVRVWSYGRSAVEIRSAMQHLLSGRESGLLGYWPLDEGSGATVHDHSMGGSDGSIISATWTIGDLPPSAPLRDALYIAGDKGLYGSTVPPYGVTNNLAHNDTFTCEALAGWQSDIHDSRYRAVCAGYNVYTNANAAPIYGGNTTSFAYTHNTNYPLSLLMWQWDAEYKVAIAAGSGGAVSTSGGWYDHGIEIPVTATPDAGYSFYRWDGDVTPGQALAATITLTSDVPKSATAMFLQDYGGTGTLYHVATWGNDSNNGSAWDKAKLTIQAAIDAADHGDTIRVAGGTYAITNQLEINKGVVLEAVEGPGATTITRASGNMRIINMTHGSAELLGFKIFNGYGRSHYVYGFGISMSGGLVSNCVVTGCYSLRGSNIYMSGGRITHSLVIDNTEAGDSGGTGGAYLNGGGAIIENSVLTRNRAGTGGGNSTLILNGAATARNCVITNNYGENTAVQFVSSVSITGAGAKLENCLIDNNDGRGVEMSGAGIVRNCTVTRNRVYGGVGNGIWMSAGQVFNTIAYYNGKASYPSLASDIARSGGVVSNSCSGASVVGGANTTEPPLFRGRESGDFFLLPGSPCIDTGRAGGDLPTDLAGRPRVMDGDGDLTAVVDMGCYEMEAADEGSFRVGFTATQYERIGSLSVTFTPHAAGAGAGNVIFAGWSFGDGDNTTKYSLDPVDHTYGSGFYNVSLVASNNLGQEARATLNNYIRVAGEGAYVATNGAHIMPYDNWAKAATNITDAVMALIRTNNEVRAVFVSNGVYLVSEELQLTTPVCLLGVNGPGVTTIQAKSNFRTLTVANPAAVVEGMRITGGRGGQGSYGVGLTISSGTVTNCVISGNQSTRGSIVSLAGSNSLLVDSVIRDNVEGGDWGGNGGVRMTGGSRMVRCAIIKNKAGSEPDGIMALSMSDSGTLVDQCVITNNYYYKATTPSIVASIGSGATLRNTLIANNQGRGINFSGAGAIIENCTVTGNSYLTDVANGISMSAGTVRNSVVWDNGIDNTRNLGQTGGTLEFCDVNPPVSGNGNINSDPLFRDAAAGDYRLQPASPLIDAGTNMAWMAAGTDLDGSPRQIAAGVDIGCYEAPDPNQGPLTCNFESDVFEGFADLEIGFTAITRGSNTNITTYAWDFGDGHKVAGSDKRIIKHTYIAPGFYTVSLAATNNALEGASITKSKYVYVVPQTIHISTNGLHVAPYSSWANAATNVADAMTMVRVINGQATEVLLSNGVYRLLQTLFISQPITVRSVNGPGVTTLTRGGVNIHILNLNNSLAVVDGLQIKGGIYANELVGGVVMNAGTVRGCIVAENQGYRAAGGMLMYGGTVSNTVFTGNYDNQDYANAAGAFIISGGLVSNCEITNNRGGNFSGAVGGIKITGGIVENSRIVKNSYLFGSATAGGVAISGSGVLRNCLVGGNKDRGVAQSGGTVINCTVVRNGGTGINFTGGKLANTISYFNGGGDFDGAGTNFGNMCVPGLDASAGNGGNVAGEPGFKNSGSGAGVTWVEGDYRLTSASSCVNAGAKEGWMDAARDLAGETRVRGARVDIGAYEAQHFLNTIILLR